ncbi:MAG TPA: PKD domain-containing protein [Thermoplasmata archaeon]|nr:PKD domain-containing protein [Thermoplasmata archaeon]
MRAAGPRARSPGRCVSCVLVAIVLASAAGAGVADAPHPGPPAIAHPGVSVSFRLLSDNSTNGCGSVPIVAKFSASAGGGAPPYSYNWSFGDGTPNVTAGPLVTHDYAQWGSYDVNVSVTDRVGSMAGVGMTVNLIPPPCPSVAPPLFENSYVVIAILVSVGLVAVGLFYGLRGRKGPNRPTER